MHYAGEDGDTNVDPYLDFFSQGMILEKLTHAVGSSHACRYRHLVKSSKDAAGEAGRHRDDPGGDEPCGDGTVDPHEKPRDNDDWEVDGDSLHESSNDSNYVHSLHGAVFSLNIDETVVPKGS